MNYKTKCLYDKVYSNFIKGYYGVPKIPNKNEVLAKIDSITSEEYIPIINKTLMDDIDISKIRKNFSDIIDDIEVLFSSIENESKEVLDQLTNSLKEHNGIKREMRRIKTAADDISNGKLGEEYLQYNFTESFDTSTNINVHRSDPINFDAGQFSISKDTSNILSLNHYRGSKIEFNIVENFSQITEYGYVGSSDASLILDQEDPRQLVYKINTVSPTKLRAAFSLQLDANGAEVSINSVVIDVDSDIAKGYIRLYYKDNYEWRDVNTQSIQEIKSDKVVFNFPDTKTSFIKIEFIKDSPDSFDSNVYYYIINNIAISRSTAKRTATLYSKPIIIPGYSSEIPIVTNISASGDVDIPKNCDVKVFVAQDIKISGGFLNSGNALVSYDSPDAYVFDNTYNGTVYLSELKNSEDTISGIINYKNLDFNWQEIQFFQNNFEQVPKVLDFNNTKSNTKIVNSLFTIVNPFKFGDLTYTGIYNLSGWVNVDNPEWATLEPLVASGIYVSGINVATLLGIAWEDIEDSSGNLHPDILSNSGYSGQWIGYSGGVGYPFGYELEELPLVYNDYTHNIDGWWRPYSELVTPTGIDFMYSSGRFLRDQYNNFIPDFYFNNISFYKIFKFGKRQNALDSTIRLYTYQERPIDNDSDIYSCNFKWKYKSKFINKVGIQEAAVDPTNPSSWVDYVIPISTSLSANEEFILDSIAEVRIHNTSTILEPREYQVITSGTTITGIDLSMLSITRELFKTTGVSFDYKYLYRTKNEYLSTWTAYIISKPGTDTTYISIPNIRLVDKNINLIQKIVITNLNTGQTSEYSEDNGGVFNIIIPLTDLEEHFKIIIYCASNDENGFCANNWIPFEGEYGSTITIGPFIKVVSRLDPIKMVSLDTLIYDSSIGEQKGAIYIDNNEKYIVVKSPTKDALPGYYFDTINKLYYSDSTKQIENKTNWIRQNAYNDSGVIKYYYYTTGSSDNVVYKSDFITRDLSWNNGNTMVEFPNYTGISTYPHHTTYGYPINLDPENKTSILLFEGDVDPRAPFESGIVGSDSWYIWLDHNYPNESGSYARAGGLNIIDSNRGFLFYNTAENLPSYYSISYRTVDNIDDTNNRFLYKISLISDNSGSLVPKIRSIRFNINKE